MLVKQVLLFIEQLNKLSPLISCDSELSASLSNRFITQDSDKLLDPDDIEFILNCYKRRFLDTVDTENDCLLNAYETNQLWSGFAQDLAADTGKAYYQILFPPILNEADPNDQSNLAETTRPVNFYLGNDGKTLYRKRSLCEHLIKNHFKLSIYRDLPDRDSTVIASSSTDSSKTRRYLSYLTIDELTRLKFCTRVNSQFTIGDEGFDCFWDFLEKKSFPRLKEQGEMPLQLLPHLLSLIEQYYLLKSSQSDYPVFKKAVTDFLNLFLTENWKDINHFYGEKVVYQGQEHYLLDLLITINQSNEFELDETLNAIATWLYRFNGALKSSLPILTALYTPLVSPAPVCSSSSQDLIAVQTTNDKLHQCFALILSLLTTSFDGWSLSRRAISLWDRRNKVFYEGAEIFKLFLPALNDNNEKALLVIYSEVLDKYFQPDSSKGSPSKGSPLAWLTENSNMTRWYQRVGQGELSKMNVNWHEPEILLQTLLFFKPSSEEIQPKIKIFLDHLIQTCSQVKNDLLMRFRINCLLADLIKEMGHADIANLNILLQLYDIKGARFNFLDNCTYYIRSRLEQIADGSLHFDATVTITQSAKSTPGFSQVSDILHNFKTSLSSSVGKIKLGLYEQLVRCLRDLSRPILTEEDKEIAEESARIFDYLASPT